MSDYVERARWVWLRELNKEEDKKILTWLEGSVGCGDEYEKWVNSGNFDSDSVENHEEYLEEMTQKERLEVGPLRDHGLSIPNFYRKYR